MQFTHYLYALPNQGNFTPFFGAGVGVAQNKVSGSFTSNYYHPDPWSGYWPSSTKTNFAYDFTAGVDYKVNEHVGVSLAYQYLAMGKLATGAKNYDIKGQWGDQTLSAGKFSSNNIMLGVSYKF